MGFALLFWSFPLLLWLALSLARPCWLAGWAAFWVDRAVCLVAWADPPDFLLEPPLFLAYAAASLVALFIPLDAEEPQD